MNDKTSFINWAFTVYYFTFKSYFCEFKKTKNIPPFEKSWNASSSLDIIKDWDKIKEIRDARRPMYPAKCSTCDKDFEVPFKPDGVRPVYCKEHMPQKR